MKRVLVFTSSFPPLGGIAQARIASFVRHLPAFGWEPSVITIDWTRENSDWIDDSLGNEELEARVLLRTREPDLRKKKSSKWPSLLRPEGFAIDWRAALAQLRDRRKHGERIDGSWYYIRAVERFLETHLSGQRYDLILATSPDLAPHRIASTASRRYGIPWVADCRDDYATLKATHPVYAELELEFLRDASAIVTVSQGVREALEKRTGKLVEVVENGYEETGSEIKHSGGRMFDGDHLNIVYTGSLAIYYPERNPEVLLAGIAKLQGESEEPVRIRVHFFGDTKLQPVLDDLIEKYPSLEPVLVDHKRVPFAEAQAAQREADLLLILAHPGLKGILTGKVFEYLAARRLIVSVPGDRDELDALLERTGGGRSLAAPDEATEFLRDAYEAWQKEGRVPCRSEPSEIEKYSRRQLAGRLAAILERAAAPTGTQPLPAP